jgi:hypothetical protein
MTVVKMLAFVAAANAYQVTPMAGRANVRAGVVEAKVGLIYSTTTGARSPLRISSACNFVAPCVLRAVLDRTHLHPLRLHVSRPLPARFV